jgi:hypothetical protein
MTLDRMTNTTLAALALMLQGGVTGCNIKDLFEAREGGTKLNDLLDTGGASGETGLFVDTGDTSIPGVDVVDLGQEAECTLTDVQGNSFQSHWYDDWNGVSGTECRCQFVLDPSFTPDTLLMTITGSACASPSAGCTGVIEQVPAGTKAYPVWLTSYSPATSIWWITGDERWSQGNNIPRDGNDLAGLWEIRLSRFNRITDGSNPASYTACGDYQDVRVVVNSANRALPQPVRRPVSPLGPESDRDCLAGQTQTTSFQLTWFPGMIHMEPLVVGGNGRYTGARVKSVTVTDWNNADEMRVYHAGEELVLTPSTPTVAVSADTWLYGSNRWVADRVADNEVFTAPSVEISLECPTTPLGDTIAVEQGYGMSLQQLDEAMDDVTGGVGLPGLISSATDPTIPVYAVRVEEIEFPKPGGPTHLLRLELRGTWAAASLPMTQTGQDSWALDTNGPEYDFEGTVTRLAGTLTISLTGGSAETGGDPMQFLPATIVLSTLGE